MNDRTCIVTREQAEPDELIRFVVGAGRRRRSRSEAQPSRPRRLGDRRPRACRRRRRKKAFSRGRFEGRRRRAGRSWRTGSTGCLPEAALGALGLARKAGVVALGAAKVEAAVRSGERACWCSMPPRRRTTAMRKIAQAQTRDGPCAEARKSAPTNFFPRPELDLALGGTNVIHAAVLAGDAGKSG